MANTDFITEERLAQYHDELMETHIAGGAVFDISAYHASGNPLTPATYADLAAALGTNGTNIPEPLRKGGMSVKFVQSPDNKYVQYRLMSDSWSTTKSDWSFDFVEQEKYNDFLQTTLNINGKTNFITQKVYSDNAEFNSYVKKLYIDKSGYTGSYDLSGGLSLINFRNNNNHLWFGLVTTANKSQNVVLKDIDVTDKQSFTESGIFVYLELDSSKVKTEGFNLDLTDFCYLSTEDPRQSVDSDMLKDASVTESKIGPGAVTSGKLAPNSVNSSKISDSAFFNINIINNVPSTAYSDKYTARLTLPESLRKPGVCICYLLTDGWHYEQFMSSDTSVWDRKWHYLFREIPMSEILIDADFNSKVDAYELFQQKNLFNPANVISDTYVDYIRGVTYLAGYAVSGWIKLPYGTTAIRISNVTLSPNFPAVAFMDENYNMLHPVDENNQDIDTYNILYGTIIYVPATARYVCFTCKGANAAMSSNIQLEVGTSITDYQEYGNWKIKQKYIPESTNFSKKFLVVKEGVNHIIRTSFNATYDIIVTVGEMVNTNGILNIKSAKLITKNADISDTGYELNGAWVDDTSPSSINNGFIGGNHGNPAALTITANSHGKTLADVGSIYEDSQGVKFYLLKVLSGNTLLMISENLNSDDKNWIFKTNPSGTLTYQSNGSDVNNIIISSVATTQLYPSVMNVSQALVADGITIKEDGSYQMDDLVITEYYDIVSTPDMVNKLVANRPSGGYTSQPTFTDADAVLSVITQYNFEEQCKCVVTWSWIARKDLYLKEFYGQQSCYHQPSWITDYKRYAPNVLPWVDNGNTIELRIPKSIYSSNQALTDGKKIGTSNFENNKRPLRLVDMLISNTLNINFNFGVLEVANLQNISDYTDYAWYFRAAESPTSSNFWKAYPYVINSKLNSDGYVAAGTIVQGANFRGWSEKTNDRTNLYCFKNGEDYYIFADWHESKHDNIPIPTSLSGKQITIIDKSNNVAVNGNYATSGIDVHISPSEPMYGYVVIKI